MFRDPDREMWGQFTRSRVSLCRLSVSLPPTLAPSKALLHLGLQSFPSKALPTLMRFRPTHLAPPLRPGRLHPRTAPRPRLPLHAPFLLRTVPAALHAVPASSHVLVCGLGLLGFCL